MQVAVVGHVEWVEFVRGDHVPVAGEIVHAKDSFGAGRRRGKRTPRPGAPERSVPGCVVAPELGPGRRRLGELEVTVEAATRKEPTRRAHTFLDSTGERTITTIGERLEPAGSDPLDWSLLEGADGVYVTAADDGALRAARTARVVVASPRAGKVLTEAGIELDALVFSDQDEHESGLARSLEPRPSLLVATRGDEGGRFMAADGRTGTWAATPPTGPIVDTYGSGDSFAAALTYGLAAGGRGVLAQAGGRRRRVLPHAARPVRLILESTSVSASIARPLPQALRPLAGLRTPRSPLCPRRDGTVPRAPRRRSRRRGTSNPTARIAQPL